MGKGMLYSSDRHRKRSSTVYVLVVKVRCTKKQTEAAGLCVMAKCRNTNHRGYLDVQRTLFLECHLDFGKRFTLRQSLLCISESVL